MIILSTILAAAAATASMNIVINLFGSLRSMSHRVISLQLDILDEENEHEESDVVSMAAAITASRAKHRRRPPMYRQRLDWKKHIKRLKKERQFDQMYRMRYASFCKLLSLLSPALKVDQLQAQR
jgi:hypothetical protein